jgi:hypothetical protein
VKAIGGILSGIVLALLFVLVVSIITYLMNVAYDQQLMQESYVNDFISSPKAFQVGPSTIVSNRPLDVRYVIYPNGQVKNLSQPFDGRVDLSGLLNGNPWAYVVLSNGQAFNITQPQINISNINSESSTISLLSLEKSIAIVDPYPINVFDENTYYFYREGGFTIDPLINTNGNLEAFNLGYVHYYLGSGQWVSGPSGVVALIPVNSSSGWLNMTVGIYGSSWSGVGIQYDGVAIAIGLKQTGADGGPLWITQYYLGWPWPWTDVSSFDSQYGTGTYRVAIHFQQGQNALVYVYCQNWVGGWVPVYFGEWGYPYQFPYPLPVSSPSPGSYIVILTTWATAYDITYTI